MRKIIIVGGVAGGASAAAKARRADEQAEITIFERGAYISFANCGLPYYISQEIKERASLFVQTPQQFWQRFKVQAKVLHEVLSIDRAQKKVQVKNLVTGEIFAQNYDKLILSPGAGALVPPIEGIKSENIFTVKTVPDSDAIKNFIEQKNPKRAVVIGGGFIGLESAEALKRRGLHVTVVEMLPQVLPPFDADMAAFVGAQLKEEGIHLVLGDGVKSFVTQNNFAHQIELQSGTRLDADLIILSIGVRPELQLAKDCGLNIGASGAIEVNQKQQTSDPDIYAAGDASEVVHLVNNQKTRIPLAAIANKQGRVAGANAAGEELVFPGAFGTAIVETMGIVAAKTGFGEREAQKAGIDYYVSYTHSMDHAGYYPGAELMHIKLLAEKSSGRLLGAQIIGSGGVDKRIDVVATALAARMKVTDLENLDLAYAPKFSSAKDPVIIAGSAASNVLRAELKTITCQDLKSLQEQKQKVQLIDVRTKQEYVQGFLDGATLLPIDELRDRLQELDPKVKTVVYCKVGLRGYLAARILQQSGFQDVCNLTGGILVCGQIEEKNQVLVQGNFVSVQEMNDALKTNSAQIIDVRNADEFFYENVSKTRHLPLDNLAEQGSLLDKNRPVYVFCQTGVRSVQAAQILRAQGFKQVSVVQGGITAYKAAGFKVNKSKGPIPVMRQVQIVAGSMALIGGLFFNWLAVLVGGGLIFAGVSGTCMMANVLMKLPWNKQSCAPQKKDAQNNSCSPCGK